MLVWPPRSQTWNLMLLYLIVSTLNPMAGAPQPPSALRTLKEKRPLTLTRIGEEGVTDERSSG